MPNIKKIVVSGSAISQLTNDAGYALATAISGAFTSTSASIAVDIAALEAAVGAGGTLISSSIQVDHDATTNFVANEHIDHTSVSITAGSGLSGGGTIAATRTLTLDTASAHFTNGVKTKLNTDGVISSSAQLTTEFDTRYLNTTGDAVISSSAQVTISSTTGFTTFSSSIATDIAALEAAGGATFSSSIASRATSLEGRTTTLEGSGTIQGVGTTNNVTFANVTATGNVSITGDLFVDGTTTTINSTNLNIEDKFLLLNSGSTGPSYEGGIIVESGSTGTGNAFYYDASDNRWSLKGGLVATNTAAVTAEAFMSVAVVDTTSSVQTAGTYYKAGNIIIDGQDIYIVTV